MGAGPNEDTGSGVRIMTAGGIRPSPIRRSQNGSQAINAQTCGWDPTEIVGAGNIIPTMDNLNAFVGIPKGGSDAGGPYAPPSIDQGALTSGSQRSDRTDFVAPAMDAASPSHRTINAPCCPAEEN